MTKTKTTKRALVASVLSLLLCVSMLVGSTFAWFTDSASTSVNKIQAGELKIAFEYYDREAKEWKDAETAKLDFIKANYEDEILWEPGATYELPQLRVRNIGNLALRFDVIITGIDGDAKLNEAIEWTTVVSGNDGIADFVYTDEIKARFGGYPLDPVNRIVSCGTTAWIDLSGRMKEDAGNEFQGLSIDGVSITIVATQIPGEFDSNGMYYDKDATYPVADQTALGDALANAQPGETISLAAGNYTLPNSYNDGITVDGNGAVVALPQNEGPYNRINTNGTTFTDMTFVDAVTLTGSATFINCTFEKGWNVTTANGDITLIGCTFNGRMHIDSGNGSKFVAKDTAFNNGVTAKLGAGGTFEFTQCSFAGTVYSKTNATLYNAAHFDSCTFTQGTNTSNVYLPNNEPVTLVTAENCIVLVSHGSTSTTRTITEVK